MSYSLKRLFPNSQNFKCFQNDMAQYQFLNRYNNFYFFMDKKLQFLETNFKNSSWFLQYFELLIHKMYPSLSFL